MEHIFQDPNFQDKLAKIAAATEQSLDQVQEEAQTYLSELYTEHKPFATIIGIQIAQYILARGYEKNIDVNPAEIKALTKLIRRHPIAFVMTHKTYIDMFVLGIVLVRHGLPIPYIFGGINMAFMGLGELGKKAGAIFIRRDIKDNVVYKTTLRHYIAYLVKEQSQFMWAIEGTRSRTGKLVWPKMGILKYIMEAEKDTDKEVKYIPVSIVYDLIPDVKEMTKEAQGKLKSAESLQWFVDYIQKMGEKFGRISLRFGDPMDINADHKVELPQLTDAIANQSVSTVSKFALGLVHKINQITPVTTTSLVCVSLLSKYALTKRAIESDVSAIMQFIESYKPEALVDRGKPIGQSVQTAINLLRKAFLVDKQSDAIDTKYVINAENYLSTTYYANMAVHHLYQQAFIELAFSKVKLLSGDQRMEAFWQEIMDLRDLFKFEFFYSRKEEFTEEIEQNLSFVAPEWEHTLMEKADDIQNLLENQRILLSPVVLNTYVEAYLVVGHGLLSWNPHYVFDEEEFIKKCVLLGEEMQWQGSIQRVEPISTPFLKNGIRLVKHLDLIPGKGDEKKESIKAFNLRLQNVADRIKAIQTLTLSKPHSDLITVPIERELVPGSRTESITSEIMEDEKGSTVGAFFDLDRTLIKGFSAKEFITNRVLSGKMKTREIVAQFAGVLVYAGGQGNFAGLAALSAQGVKGVDEGVFVKVGEDVYQKYLADEIYPESRELVAAHMAMGHTVAIVSAATPYQVNPIARDLNITHVMCTRMEVKKGKFTGEIIEPACWGEGKFFAANELAEKHNLDLSKSYFYTDSAEDLPLLERVGNPRPLNPDPKLTALAFKNDWPIYRFSGYERPGVSNLMRTGAALAGLVPAILNGVASGSMNMSWREGVNSMMATVGDLVISLAGVELVVNGEEYLENERPAVFVLNHQSNIDLFLAAKLIRHDAVGIAKKELKSYPVIGQMMQAAGIIFVDRKNSKKAIAAMAPAIDALKNGTSIIIFPEGTRSYDYQLGSFKKGAFHLAMEAGVPMIPIVIKNAHDAMPRGSNIFRPTAIEINVLKPVDTKDWTKANLNEQVAAVRKLYLDELDQIEFEKPKGPAKPKFKDRGKKRVTKITHSVIKRKGSRKKKNVLESIMKNSGPSDSKLN